jgi:cold shock CspA family protein
MVFVFNHSSMRDRMGGYLPSVEKGKEVESNKKGIITSWNAERGYGFIAINGKNVFCHATELCAHVRPAKGKEPKITNVVVGSIEKKDKRFAAHSVECEDCARPTVWEIVPTQERIGTIYKYSIESPKKGVIPTPPEIIEKLKQANAAYEQAQEEQISWNSAYTAGILFKKFGKPDAVRFNAETNEIVVTYNDRGEKSFKPAYFLNNEVYAERFTGRIDRSGDAIEVEIAFDEIPGVFVRELVVSIPIPGMPRKRYYFKKLPAELQRQAIELAREQVKSPAEVAEQQLRYKLTEQRDTAREWNDVCTSLEQVQYPGELFLTTRSETVTVDYPESLDGYRPAGSYRELVYKHYLVVGARKVEPYPRWVSDYTGGTEFFVTETSRRDTPRFPVETPVEEVRSFLIDNFKKKQQRLLEAVKKEARVFAPDPDNEVIYGMSESEWIEHYNEAWDAVQKKLLEETERQQAENIARKKVEWDTYSTVAEQIKKYRAECSALLDMARTCHVTLLTNTDDITAHRSRLGADPLDLLNREFDTLTAWLPRATKELNDAVQARGEVLFATPADREKAMAEKAQPARWFLSNISEDRIKAYGRAPGEGFGLKDALIGKYLPGKRGVIGLSFQTLSKNTERYTYVHMSPLEQLPEANVYRHNTEIIGLTEDADWRILGVTSSDGEAYLYRLINERGNATYMPQDDGSFLFESKNWDGINGAGPTVDEVLSAHALKKNERKNWSVQRADSRSAPPTEPPVSPMSGVLGSKFAAAFEKNKVTPHTATSDSPRPDTARRPAPEKVLSPEQLAVLYDECRVKRSYLRALILGIPNHKDWREKKSDLLTLLSVTEHEAPTFSSRTEYDKIMGKLSEVERRCSKLLASADYKSSASKISNPHWAKDVQEIWKNIPDQIVTEVGELISVANQAAVRDTVYARAGEIVEQLQQGKQPDLKKMIDDAAEQYL